MEITVLVERVANNGFRARAGEPLPLSADGASADEAVRNLRSVLGRQLMNGTELVRLELGTEPDPWSEFAGMFKDDPWIADWKRSVEEYRQKVDDDPDAL